MFTKKFLFVPLCVLSLFIPKLQAAEKVPFITQPEAAAVGLTRTWYHQVKVLSAQHKIQHIVVEGGQMFIVTSDANLHTLDSNTGQWLWSRGLGTRNYMIAEPAANSQVVAVVNGLDLFIFSRKSGKLLYQQEMSNVPTAPLTMSENYLYLPMPTETMTIILLKQIPPEIKEIEKIKTAAAEKIEKIDDPALKKVVEQFEDAKKLFRADNIRKQKEDGDIILDDTHRVPMTCVSMGLLTTKPILVRQIFEPKEYDEALKESYSGTHLEMLAWVVKGGYVFAANIEKRSEREMALRYRVNSSAQTYYIDKTRTYQREVPGHKEMMVSPSVSQPVPANDETVSRQQMPSIMVTGGRSTYIFAVNCKSGNVLWQYPTRGELLEPIAIIGRDVYAPVKSTGTKGGLHYFDVMDGVANKASEDDKKRIVDNDKFWFTPNVSQFVAASKKKLYVLDDQRRLTVLDKETGTVLKRFDTRAYDKVLFNTETNQIFLVTDRGLVQCLCELDENGNAPLIRHRLSSAEYVSLTKRETWDGDSLPNTQKTEILPGAEAKERETEEEIVKKFTQDNHIRLWWEDTLPDSEKKKKTEQEQ